MKELTEYYVASLWHIEQYGWISLHRTNEGAKEKLIQTAAEWGIYVQDWVELGEHRRIESVGISYLPVEE
jgi:hypothetical protein